MELTPGAAMEGRKIVEAKAVSLNFKIKITCGGEVNWAGVPSSGPIYYGGALPDSGIWKLDMVRLGDYIESNISGDSFGESVETFVLGFEIGELEGWGNYFTSMCNYTSYRPKMKLIVSVGQLNWPEVKDLDAQAQFDCFANALFLAVSHISQMKRKPRDFDVGGFLSRIQSVLLGCSATDITARIP